MVNRLQRALWLAAVIVTLVAFGLVIPKLPSVGPGTMLLTTEDTMDIDLATVTVPAGWSVDIASAARGQAIATRGDVRVGITDALWLGSSGTLVERVADVVFTQGATLPSIPADADGTGGERWEIAPSVDAPPGDPRRVIVLRRDAAVVLVVVRGPESDVAAVADTIDSIVTSVVFSGVRPDVGGPK